MNLTRRRFLTLASAAALVAPSAAHAFRWQGVALGAQAQIILDHPQAERITTHALAEIDRLENVFSLYRPDSDLRRLNAAGRLHAPAFELLECLSTARRVHAVTGGLFDPTVQPLWQVLAEGWASGQVPDEDQIDRARDLIGFERMRFDSGAIELADGQALTLNGIAQGYIADRVASLMRDAGIEDVLIDTGEVVAKGGASGRDGWPVAIAGTRARLALTDRALATSAHDGTVFDPAGRVGHILDPRTGVTRHPAIRQISISAPDAALADALSTGLCLAKIAEEAVLMLRNVPMARLESIRTDTNVQWQQEEKT